LKTKDMANLKNQLGKLKLSQILLKLNEWSNLVNYYNKVK